ncbi:hypothetical protein [Psychrobacter sp.]|uniref:hypothetical protein n=1 Tax=Psychrobacter sp. TaxID=56811 RepID=UPI003C70A8D7
MKYQKYIDLFTQAQKQSISDFLDSDFHDELVSYDVINIPSIVKDKLKSQMLTLVHKPGIENYNFRALEKQLLRQYLWTKLDCQKRRYDVFNLLFSHNGYQDEYSELDKDWVDAITVAIYLFDRNLGYCQNIYTIENVYTKQSKSVEACRYFRKKGYDITIKNGEIKSNNINLIFKMLDYKAMKLGGVTYDSFTKNLLTPIFNDKSSLYEFPIASSSNNEDLLPLGLIFKLSTKYIDQAPIYAEKEIQTAYEYFLELSRKYALIFECQSFGHDFEMILMSNSVNLFNKIEEVVLTDNFYKIEQYIYGDVFDFVAFISNKFLEGGVCKEEIKRFMATLQFIRSKIDSNNLLFDSCETPDGIDKSILDIFTFNNGVNQGFKGFHDFDKVDSDTKILINNNNSYRILHPQFFSIAVYRVLYKLIESKTGDSSIWNSNIGNYIEDFLEWKMQEKNFNAIHGRKYYINKHQRKELGITSEEGECDILLSTQKYLVFIEIKKKEFTPIAKKGNILFILDDLSKCLLTSQKQANKHMRYITRFQEIKFLAVDCKPEVTVRLQEREILKISVSSLDYLSLHSKTVFQKFIRLLYNKEVLLKDKASLEDIKIINNFNKLNKHLSEELNNIDSDFQLKKANGFFNSFFMNIFHIVFMINNSNDIEEFTERLISNRSRIMAYNDFYHESLFIEKLRQSSDGKPALQG